MYPKISDAGDEEISAEDENAKGMSNIKQQNQSNSG